HFHIEFVDPSYDLRIKQTLTIKPEGLKIRVRPRQRMEILPSYEAVIIIIGRSFGR
ncbi:unnamed protein product, partial [Rotaria magnacalcarata]